MSVYDRWHLAHPPDGARKCSAHRLVPSGVHGKGLRWQVRGLVDDDGNAIPKETFEHEEDAKLRDAELRVNKAKGELVDAKRGKVTFEEFAKQWSKVQTHDHSTAERIESQLRNHCYEDPGNKGKTPTGRFPIGARSMGALSRSPMLVKSWVVDLALSANTARLLIGVVESIFAAAVDERIIGRNPLKSPSGRKNKSKPKRVKTEVAAWTPDEVEAACQELPAELQAMGYLGAVTGARQGELFGVALSDLDFLRRQVTYSVQVAYVGGRLCFKPLKNDKPRTVPIGAPVLPVLSEHVRAYPPVAVTLPWSEKGSKLDGKPVTRLLVFHDEGKAYFRQTVNRHWRRAWQAAGIKDRGRQCGMHVLRHSAASRWLSNGLNPAKVAAYLGDTLAVVIDTYSHWLPVDEDMGRAIMDAYLTPGKVPSEVGKCQENARARN